MDLYNPLVDSFTLRDAGFLLCNHAPLQRWNPKHGRDPDEVIRKRAEMTIAELQRCAAEGFLEIADKNIQRTELERWVFTKDIRPVFLFPENEPEDVSDKLFDAYKHIDGFTLYDAGFLLCGHAPLPIWWSTKEADPHQAVRGSADTMARKLVSEARSGTIKVFGQNYKQIEFRNDGLSDEEYNDERRSKWGSSLKGRGLLDRWFVMRDDLVEWVEQKGKGQEPVFLFKDAIGRISKSNTSKKESTLLTENLYKAFFCVVANSYQYDPNASKSNVPRDVSNMMLEEYGFDKDNKTIKRWLKKGAFLVEEDSQK